METLLSVLTELKILLVGTEATRLSFVGLLALATFIVTLAIMLLMAALASPVRKRLRSMTASTVTATDDRTPTPPGKVASKFASVVEQLNKGADGGQSGTQAQLTRAGFRSPTALMNFYASKLLAAAAIGAVTGVVLMAAGKAPLAVVVTIAIGGAGVGYMLPNAWLSRKERHRMECIARGMPDGLDLLVVCTEAGLGLHSAIQRVTAEIGISHPELADELSTLDSQLRVGVDKRVAFRQLAERTGVDDMRSLVATLLQSMRFGTSIADTLRIYAEELRDKRMQRAEESAAKVAIKMIFPMAFCMLPAMLVIGAGPAVLGAMRVLERLPTH